MVHWTVAKQKYRYVSMWPYGHNLQEKLEKIFDVLSSDSVMFGICFSSLAMHIVWRVSEDGVEVFEQIIYGVNFIDISQLTKVLVVCAAFSLHWIEMPDKCYPCVFNELYMCWWNYKPPKMSSSSVGEGGRFWAAFDDYPGRTRTWCLIVLCIAPRIVWHISQFHLSTIGTPVTATVSWKILSQRPWSFSNLGNIVTLFSPRFEPAGQSWRTYLPPLARSVLKGKYST